MADHNDTKDLSTYKANRYPSIPGYEAAYIAGELVRIGNVINKLVDVVKLIEKRLNDNALT